MDFPAPLLANDLENTKVHTELNSLLLESTVGTNGSGTEVEKVSSNEGIHDPGVIDHENSDRETDDLGESEYDEEEEESGTEDEEDEPALKYERIRGFLPDLFKKDSTSALAVSNRLMALGTHAGFVHLVDLTGKRTKTYKPHQASIIDIVVDELGEFAATASIDGQVVIQSLANTTSQGETYLFDMKRPMRTIALEPNFGSRSTRAFVCGGLAGTLILREKGWLGHKETPLHSGEGPIWHVRWRGSLIAWANDLGVKIYDTASQLRITFIDRPSESPRADLFKCTLHWQDDSTLLIAWANYIKVARIRARPRSAAPVGKGNGSPFLVEITAVFQLDCMVAGILPHPTPTSYSTPSPAHSRTPSSSTTKTHTPSLTSLLVLAYSPPDTSFLDGNELTEDRAQQARKKADRPELRIISRGGEELAADALSISDFHQWGCNDYVLVEVDDDSPSGKCYVVMSPRDIVIARPRDARDHVEWLVQGKRYEEALEAVELVRDGQEGGISAAEIGQKYIEHLISEDDFDKAARLCPKVCGDDPKRWEDWIFIFAGRRKLKAVIPYVPTDSPRLSHLVYEMMLAYMLTHDQQALAQTIREWPKDIYDLPTVIVAVRSELEKLESNPRSLTTGSSSTTILMDCLAELFTANRQYGKALPYYLRLRRPNVFDLIREHNLFTDVQDQALLLVEFDHELIEKRKKEGETVDERQSNSIRLLVDHTYSIPMERVVKQLQTEPYYLFLYLDALFDKDPHLAVGFADLQVKLYAEFASKRLIDFLRASNYYNLEAAYNVCKTQDLVPEMVFLLGRMGNNKKALHLIIERMGDVNRAIDFAKDQSDDDLWEDLLKYSETRPAFIRGLLENVGADIDPIRLIRRIKNGLEIPGLKEALIKILQDFYLQISLLEGCQTIMNGDCSDLARRLQKDQTGGYFLTAKTKCPICALPLLEAAQNMLLLFLCRHVVHSRCVTDGDQLPHQPDPVLAGVGMGASTRGMSGRIALASMIRTRISPKCPVCEKKAEGNR